MTNYFEVLNVTESAEAEVIRSAYKALAKKYHPDSTKLPKNIAAERMAIINEAYRVLSDDDTKRHYINELHKASWNNRKEEGNTCEKVDKEYVTKEYYRVDADNTKKDTFSTIMSYIIVTIVIISVVCCMIYFGPEIIRDMLSNIADSFKKVVNTF